MPKWWFFPWYGYPWRLSCEKFVITYASATAYDNQLSSDPSPLSPLPTFDEPPIRSAHQELVVGIGFTPLGLRDIYASDFENIRYIFPFPPGPPHFERNWEFLRILESEIESRNLQAEDPWPVHMYDCPSVFRALRTFTKDGERTAALAPFGPKTHSLAMCLFALAAGHAGKSPVHVLYTQPRRYALNYTTGIKITNGVPDVKRLCTLGRSDLYRSIPEGCVKGDELRRSSLSDGPDESALRSWTSTRRGATTKKLRRSRAIWLSWRGKGPAGGARRPPGTIA